jgi:hypothetical protein
VRMRDGPGRDSEPRSHGERPGERERDVGAGARENKNEKSLCERERTARVESLWFRSFSLLDLNDECQCRASRI